MTGDITLLDAFIFIGVLCTVCSILKYLKEIRDELRKINTPEE